MSEINLRNGVRITITTPSPRFTVSAPTSAVAVLPVRGPAGADGTGGTGGGVTDHGALTGLADDDHLHYHTDARGDVRYYTKAQVDTSLAGKSDTTHTHTAAAVGAEPAGTVATHEADTLDVHGIADTSALIVTTDPRLSDAREPTAHTHVATEVTDLGTAATKNTPVTGDAAATEVVLGTDSRLSDARTPTAHTHDDRYYTETEVDTALAGKAATTHGHVAADVTDLGTAATKDAPATGNALAGQVVLGSDTRLTDARTPTAHTHPATGITVTPSGTLAATDVQGALTELDAEKETPAGAQGKVDAHTGATDPHGDRAYADTNFMKRETSIRTVYVATTGSDTTGDGSSANPWRTIQYAVNQARSILYPTNGASGYTILVSPGTYAESVTIPPTAFGGVRAEGQGGIIIQSSTSVASDVVISAASGEAGVVPFGTFSLRYLTIAHDTIAVLARGGAQVQGVIRDCVIRRISASNGGNAGIYTQFAALHVRDVSSVAGQLFAYGLKAEVGGVIAKQGVTPSGSTAAEFTFAGGVIR